MNFGGGSHGYSHLEDKRIAVNEGMGESQTLETAIHEIAHAKLHDIDLNAPTLPVLPHSPGPSPSQNLSSQVFFCSSKIPKAPSSTTKAPRYCPFPICSPNSRKETPMDTTGINSRNTFTSHTGNRRRS